MNLTTLTNKQQELAKHRPLPPELVKNLEAWFRIELTHTSNAIEGNTLTRQETVAVVADGITIGGKTLNEHLEAINHAKALDWVVAKAKSKTHKITESDILTLHEMILLGIDANHAGRYRSVSVRVAGSQTIFPNHVKVSTLMKEFIQWLHESKNIHPVELATLAHYKLVTIHPFVDGNGRTARLLMNLILIQHGYPPSIIRKRDRVKYIASLENAQATGDLEDFSKIIANAVARSIDIYLKAINGENVPSIVTTSKSNLLKIGQLAKASGETTATIRHWTKEGLLSVTSTTKSGYQLYGKDMVQRAQLIRKLQHQRLSLQEIKTQFSLVK